jgi:hypothetical protein
LLSVGIPIKKEKTMACSKFSRLVISLVILGNIPNAHAQGTNQYGGSGSYATRPGGFYATGGYYHASGVPTGRGPLSQPIPPAASVINPYYYPQTPYRHYYYPQAPYRHYYYPQTPYRPRYWRPTPTNPPQYPFGEPPPG